MLGRVTLVVGIPVITSPGNLAFWLRLCKVDPSEPDAALELQRLEKAAAQGATPSAAVFRDWNLRLMQQVRLAQLSSLREVRQGQLGELPCSGTGTCASCSR